MALIELQGVGRQYLLGSTEVKALDDINLRIETGEFVAIIGQSGSGKSTLMNVLGCLDNPSCGHFLIDGCDVGGLAADELARLRRDRFGFIFQRYHLLPHLDSIGNVALPAVYAGARESERSTRAQSLLTKLGLGTRLSHFPNELSGGQQQRVSIARALMNGGQIILADEPTGALDSRSGAELLALLEELHRSGHTIILVTHDAKVAAHAKRVIELHDGKLIADSGTPSDHCSREVQAQALQAGNWLQKMRMQWREALASAIQALLGNRLRSVLSMLGISIGIAAVVSIVALTTAARGSIEKDLGSILSGRIEVFQGTTKAKPGEVAKPFRSIELDAIRALSGVDSVVVDQQSVMTGRQRSRDALLNVIGLTATSLATRHYKVIEGRSFSEFEEAEKAAVVLIDNKAREALFKPGEPFLGATVVLNLVSGVSRSPDASNSSDTPHIPSISAALPFQVIGVIKSDGGIGSFDGGQGKALIPASTFRHKLDPRFDSERFSVYLRKGASPESLELQIKHLLKAQHAGEDFTVWNSENEFRSIQNVTGALAALFAGVGAISLLVGGVGVMNIMLVSVSERTREIGIRMAIGARQADVRLQFLVEAVVLCCVGGVVGVALSWLGAQALNAIQNGLRVQISWAALALAFLVSSGIGLLFGTLPARRAAALSPVDALARE